jgi:hypothetical protein
MAFILTQEGYLQVLANDLSIADLATKDHDLLGGLGDDDHTQYVLGDGSRAMTGGLEITSAADSIITLTDTTNTCVTTLEALNTFGRVGTTSAHSLYILTSNAGRIFLDTSGGVFINDTGNANMTIGLTINQQANDDEIIALKSSDIAHGVTDHAETDTFGDILKFGALTGGIYARGFSSADTGICLLGVGTTTDSTKGITGTGCIVIRGLTKSGTGYATMAANTNVLAIMAGAGGSTTKWILDADGDTWQTGGGTFGARCIGSLAETIPEVIQQDAEPGTTYPGLIWVDTDASPADQGLLSYIQDADGDTKIQLEESADEDIIRMDVAGTEVWNMTAAGERTMALQPSFLAYLSTNQLNLAINTTHTVQIDTEVFDQGGDFNTGTYTFTAPVTGRYQINLTIYFTDMDMDTNYYGFQIITSNRTFTQWYDPDIFDVDAPYWSWSASHIFDMDASDTAYAAVFVHNSGAAQLNISGGGTMQTAMSGILVA